MVSLSLQGLDNLAALLVLDCAQSEKESGKRCKLTDLARQSKERLEANKAVWAIKKKDLSEKLA